MWPPLTCRLIFDNGVSIFTNCPRTSTTSPWEINHTQADKRTQYTEEKVSHVELVWKPAAFQLVHHQRKSVKLSDIDGRQKEVLMQSNLLIINHN